MILILAAVPLETSLLRNELTTTRQARCGSSELLFGQLRNQEVILAHGGMGQVNMAIQLTLILNSYSPDAVFLCGCGGSYPGHGLKLGDLALAREEQFGDTGVAAQDRFIPLSELPIPQDPNCIPLFRQNLQLDPTLFAWALEELGDIACGRFVTVNCCSGNQQVSRDLGQRTAGLCENMEGAAAALACDQFGVPLLELRGISNPTGTRDPREWDISRGSEAAQQGIMKLLENWKTACKDRL